MNSQPETTRHVFEEVLLAWEDGERSLIGVYGGDEKAEQLQQMQAQKVEWVARFRAAPPEWRPATHEDA